MSLLVESNFETSVLTEGKGDARRFFIEGIFAQADRQNRNGRIYPNAILEREVNRYVNEMVKTRRALGELEHPTTHQIGLDRCTHLIENITKSGSEYIGRAKILNTPAGKTIQAMLEDGVCLGVSTRGTGSLRKNSQNIDEVQQDFRLFAVDIVHQPSAPDAFVESILESQYIAESLQDPSLMAEFELFMRARQLIKESSAQSRPVLSEKLLSDMLKKLSK